VREPESERELERSEALEWICFWFFFIFFIFVRSTEIHGADAITSESVGMVLR
jgi:glucose uptake protein GlcU